MFASRCSAHELDSLIGQLDRPVLEILVDTCDPVLAGNKMENRAQTGSANAGPNPTSGNQGGFGGQQGGQQGGFGGQQGMGQGQQGYGQGQGGALQQGGQQGGFGGQQGGGMGARGPQVSQIEYPSLLCGIT